MAQPFVLVQLSDPHIGATWADGDPVAALEATVEAVRRLPDAPDAVLVSGDLADHGAPAEYELVRDVVSRIGVPVHVLPGNHDDRAALRDCFGLDGAPAAPVDYAADLGPLRLVALDSTVPGEDGGELDREQLAWLDGELASAPEAPTVVALHHPPLATGTRPWDELCLPRGPRDALAGVLAAHHQVVRVVAGHVHRAIAAELSGRVVLSAPSTYVQAALALTSDELRLTDDPPGFAVHVLANGTLASHVQTVAPS